MKPSLQKYTNSKGQSLYIPTGNPGFGIPDPSKMNPRNQYVKNVAEYMRAIEGWNGNAFGYNDMNAQQKKCFSNALRHSLGTGYLVFEGMDPSITNNLTLVHEIGENNNLDSRQDVNNNQWAARTADDMSTHGLSWPDFVIESTYSGADAARNNKGFLK